MSRPNIADWQNLGVDKITRRLEWNSGRKARKGHICEDTLAYASYSSKDAQLVNLATRNCAILDKIWSNMSPVYAHPAVLSELGSSDHGMVLLVPSSYPTLDTGMIQNRVIRRMGANERMTFASALCLVRWEYMYAMDSCEQPFQLFQETMTVLIDTCFPLKTVTRHSSDKPLVTDRFRHLIRQRQSARMSGDLAEARRLRN